MPKINFLLFLLFLCQLSCEQNSSTTSTTNAFKNQKLLFEPLSQEEIKTLEAEVDALNSNGEKRQFLLDIYTIDQQVRNESTAAQTAFGFKSTEHNAATQKMWITDKRNLIQIEAYLEKFGHPTKEGVGDPATLAPWIVIHQASEKEPRIRNFSYLHQAYKNGDLEGGEFAFYLNRLYFIEFGKRMEIKSPFREEDEIAKLIEELKL